MIQAAEPKLQRRWPMTTPPAGQCLTDESWPESVHTVEQLQERESGLFRIAAPGFTTGELWLAGPAFMTSPSTIEEAGASKRRNGSCPTH